MCVINCYAQLRLPGKTRPYIIQGQRPRQTRFLHLLHVFGKGSLGLQYCSFISRFGQLCVESQLKVFDLRFLRPMSPYDVTMLQPFLIRCLPAVSSTILVISQMGDFQLLDLRGLVTPSNMVVSHLNASAEGVMVCSMDVGPSSHSVAFGDSNGVVHMWSDQEEFVMNPYATQDPVFPEQSK